MNKIILAVLMSVCICGMAFGGSLVARYEFEGNTNDSTGVHNGTTHGNAAVVIDAQRGNVMSFDGSGDYVTVPDHAALTPSTLTVGTWVKGGLQKYKTLVGKWDYGRTDRSWNLFADVESGDPNRCQVALSDNGDFWTNHRKQYWSDVTTLDETWHHVAFTFDGPTSTLKYYVDGVEDTSIYKKFDDPITQIHDSDIEMSFGCDFDGSSAVRFFTGYLDDIQIYNYALRESEIQEIMAGNVVPEPVTIMLFAFGGLLLRRKK